MSVAKRDPGRRLSAEFLTGKPVRIPKALRAELEAAIEAHLAAAEKLTAVLDKADGDSDLEPSLGSQGSSTAGCQEHWGYSEDQDREQDVHDQPHDEVEEGNGEPSLGWVGGMNQEIALRESTGLVHLPGTSQNLWIDRTIDLEEVCEDEGAQCEDEGDLGGL